jgi:large subunit ribosomal protein L7A
VKAHKQRTVGSSATLRALQKGQLIEVIVAADAGRNVVQPVIEACRAAEVPIQQADSQVLLGKACGLSVGASTVGLLR